MGGRRQSAWKRAVLRSAFWAALLCTARPALACVGDCNRDLTVSVDELLIGVDIVLGSRPASDCADGETAVTVDKLTTAVKNARDGCNRPPQVDAGADVLTPIDQPLTLTGSVTDDGRTDTLTLQWSQVTGPGTVLFGSPNAASTTATFSALGSYDLRLTANDGEFEGSDEVTVHVDIAAANVAPTLDGVADQTITVGTTLSLRLAGHDGNPFDALTYGLVGGPPGSTVSPQGVFSFTPTAAQLGTNTVGVQVRDGGALSAQTSFDVTVVQGNRPPVVDPLADDYARSGALYTKTLTASDPDPADTLTFTLLSGPEGMSLSGPQLAWTPAVGQVGAFSVKLEVIDVAGARDRGEFVVTVPLPGTILARDDGYEVVQGGMLTVPAPGVLGNDEDLAGSTLTAKKLTDPDKGMLTAFNGDGSFTYVPPAIVEAPPVLDVTTNYQLFSGGVLYSRYPPLVADLDGDGKPEIIFWIADALYAVHGDTGELLFSAVTLPAPYDGCSMYGGANNHYAVGDIDDDGVAEIIVSAQCAADNPTYIYVITNQTRVLALAYDAAAPSKFKVKWLSQPLAPQAPIRPEDGGDGHLYVPFGGQAANASYSIARLRPTEKPTVLLGKTYGPTYCGRVIPGKTDPYCRIVFAVDGETGAVKAPYYSVPDDPSIVDAYQDQVFGGPHPAPVVADVDNDGALDILYEATLWEIDGTVKRQFDGTAATGRATDDSAVVDLDGDAEMEILTLDNANYRHAGVLKAWKADGRLLWTLPVPGTTVVSPLSIADIDRSGHPSILFGIYDTLWAVDHAGRIKWLRRLPLIAGFLPFVNGAGAEFPVYDLNGDGVPEIVVQPSKQTILFLRGDTGETQTSWSYPGQPEGSTASVQAPVIADVDGSGHASLIWYHDVNLNDTTFLQVLKGDTVSWRPAPQHFNQRAYWETNFNADGSVPTTYARHTTDPKTNLFGQQPPAPYITEPRLRTQTAFSYTATNGGIDSAPATVTIDILPENHPPVVTSMPPSAIPAVDYRPSPFTYQITAFDPDLGDVVAYQLTYQGCGFEGTVHVSPAGLFSVTEFNAAESLCEFQVRLSDGHSGVTDHVFGIFITNQARTVPNVVGLQLPAARATLFTPDLVVGRVTMVADAAPAGQVLAQNPTGGTSVLRGSSVDLTVSGGLAPEDSDDDGDGFTERQHDCDDTDPMRNPGIVELPDNGFDENCDGRDSLVTEIVVEPPSALVVQGETVAFTATAIYADGTSSDATAMGSWASAAPGVATVDGTGHAHALNPGTTAITVTFGGAVGHASVTVADRAAGDQDPPAAVITTPANGGTVTSLTQVTGTATDAHFLRYELAVALTSDMAFTTIGAGTAPVVDGVLGSFDPTLLLNDIYKLRLTVWDANGNQAIAETCLQVAGDQKVGNFTLSLLDLSVDVSGIPIEVIRTYDSRDHRRGDFGVGWALQVRTLRLSTNRVLGSGWQVIKPGQTFGLQPTDEHFVSVTLPDGQVEQFDLRITPFASPLVPLSAVQASYVPRQGTLGTLESLSNTNLLIADPQPGDVELLDDNTLNTYDPQLFRYTSPDGTQSEIHRTLGVRKVTDLNGNTVTFGPDGITHSAGKSVAFARDPQGRITQITDPSGGVRQYTYDANGDLRTSSDQAGNTTKYRYNRSHGLIDIEDPAGGKVARNEYDDDGRLIATVDAQGNRIALTHAPGTTQEVLTNRLGKVTVFEYDAAGNVVAKTDALGQRTELTYDSAGNELTQKDALNRVATKTYDAQKNVLTRTDFDGNTTTFTYNDRNQVLTTRDPEGRVTTNVYDANGNLTQVTDPEGGTTRHTYDAAGHRLTTTDPLGKVTTFGYDAFGNKTSETDALGKTTTFTYDASNRRVSETRTRTLPGGGMQTLTKQFVYDSAGRLIRTTDELGHELPLTYSPLGDGQKIATFSDANGRVTRFGYDSRGDFVESVYADGSTVKASYDAERRLRSSTDRDAHTSSYEYDAVGRQTIVTNADGTTKGTTYDAAGRVLTQIDERGNTITRSYAPNQQSVTNALHQVTVHTLDSRGKTVETTDALGHVTRYAYDSKGNLTSTTFPGGSTKTTSYDLAGRKISETDQAGKTTAFAYDPLGRLITVTDARGGVTTYAYDEVGNLVEQRDANGHTTLSEYDAGGRLTKRIRPLGQQETFTYDAQGNLVSHTDFNGDATTLDYDDSNRLLRKTLPGNTAVPYGYTPNGRRTQAGGDTYMYDSRDRLLTETKASNEEISYSYDAAGNKTSVTTPQGTTTYTYDALNRLAGATDASGTTAYTYDAVGNLASTAYPNGVSTTYTYDALNRLTRVANTGSGGLLSSYTYTLGPAGNRVHLVETGPATTGRTVTYDYDALYRLTEEVIDDPSATDEQTISYTYDGVGNRLTKTTVRGTETAGVLYAYDANDRLLTETTTTTIASALRGEGPRYALAAYAVSPFMALVGSVALSWCGRSRRGRRARRRYFGRSLVALVLIASTVFAPAVANAGVAYPRRPRAAQGPTVTTLTYTYDANGNTRSRTDGSSTDTYTYDAENRLTTATVQLGANPGAVSYAYDADGIRTSKTAGGVTTNFLVDKNQELAQVVTETTGSTVATYTYGLDLVSQTRSAIGVRFYQYDGQHSTRQLTTAAGALSDTYTYDAFGILLASDGVTANNYRYAGEQLDPNVGFYYLRARYYLPAVGRFLTTDPEAGSVFDPVSLHRYLYANADPIDNRDPSGRVSLAEISVAIFIGAVIEFGLAILIGVKPKEAATRAASNALLLFIVSAVLIVALPAAGLLATVVGGGAKVASEAPAVVRAIEGLYEAFNAVLPQFRKLTQLTGEVTAARLEPLVNESLLAQLRTLSGPALAQLRVVISKVGPGSFIGGALVNNQTFRDFKLFATFILDLLLVP